MSRLEFLLSKIRVIFLGSDEFLLKEVKKVCAKTKKFTATNYDEGEFGLNLAKNFDIALCEVRNSHCVEFIEDISYENPNLKIIALEPSLALNGGGGGRVPPLSPAMAAKIKTANAPRIQNAAAIMLASMAI